MKQRKPGEVLTPLRAIRKHCLACCETRAEVAVCPCTECFLWPLRLGSRKKARQIIEEECKAAGIACTLPPEPAKVVKSARVRGQFEKKRGEMGVGGGGSRCDLKQEFSNGIDEE